MKLNQLGEFGLIDRIRQQAGSGSGVVRGIGDDAAVLEVGAGEQLLTSTDLLIESCHFDFAWTRPEDLGHKAIAVNLSDIAAMGGTPRYLYLGLACPGDTEVDRIEAFLAGALRQTEAHGATLVGGDTCCSPGPWVIAVTVEGVVPRGEAVGRDGARPGDVVLVSGTLGDSALAFTMLRKGQRPSAFLAGRHHRPEARVELGRALASSGRVTAMIDVSDGLAADLGHILRASGTAGLVDLSSLPASGDFRQCLQENPGAADLPLNGGEDYELLFTAADSDVPLLRKLAARVGLPVTVIGEIRPGAPHLLLRDGHGRETPCELRGFDHFANSAAPADKV